MLQRIRVEGESMLPTLRPGQRLWMRTRAYRRRGPRVGDVVVLQDPRTRRPLVKRVKKVDGVPGSGPTRVHVQGDNPEASTDSRDFGAVPLERILGRVVGRR